MIELPNWLQNMPDPRAKTAAKQRFFLRLAALYASEDGTLVNLAIMLGIKENTFKSQALAVCRASEQTREGIRQLLGDAFVPPTDIGFRPRPKNNDAL